MATSVDFTIIGMTDVPGVSLIVANNEDAFRFMTEDEELDILADGSAPLFSDCVGDFISDAGWENYTCDLV